MSEIIFDYDQRTTELRAAITTIFSAGNSFYEQICAAGFTNIFEGYTSNFRHDEWFAELVRKIGSNHNIQHNAVCISNAYEAELTNSLVPISTIEAGVRHVLCGDLISTYRARLSG